MASLEQLPPSFVDTITLPLKIFSFIGLDFFDDAKMRFKNDCKLILFIIGLFAFLGGQMLFFFYVDEIGADFLEIANAIPCLVLLLQDVFKLVLIRKKHIIRRIILEIAELWPTEFHTEEKEEVMNDWIRRMKAFCDMVFKATVLGIVVYMYIAIFVYFFSSYSDESTPYMYPFQLYYFIKIDTMWKYLVFYAMQAVLGTIIHTCIYWSCDLLLVTLTVDVCILLRLLQHDLENIRVERISEKCLADLKHIVKTHQKLLRLAENLNEIFGGIMFTVVVFSSVILCFFGFLTIVVTDRFQLFKNFITVLQILFIVFYIMLPGQILSNTSSGVADAAYHSLWYNSDLKFRKIIFIIIASRSFLTEWSWLHDETYLWWIMQPSQYASTCYKGNYVKTKAEFKICSSAWSYLSLVNQMYQKGGFDMVLEN